MASSRKKNHGKEQRDRPPKSAPPAKDRVALAALLLIAAAGIWAYSTSFAGVFVFDDLTAIVDNAHIRQLWPLTGSMSAPRDTTVAGRPVASLTLALNYALAPRDARAALKPAGIEASPEAGDRFLRNVWGYHALNLALHLLSAFVLFGIVRQTLRSARLPAAFGEASSWLAGTISLLWAVHPLQTQAVTYVVQRVELLMGLFYLLTLYCAIRAGHDGKRSGFWKWAAVLACALGMGSKEVMVTAPLMVPLWDFLFADGSRRQRRSFYAGLAACWIVLAALVLANPRPGSVGFDLGGWSWWSYLKTQAEVIVHYLRLAIVPYPLVFDYAWPKAQSLASVAPQAVFLIALVLATAWFLMRRHPLGFPGAWFFLVLAPSSSILPVPTEVAAEHRMYLPLAAILALAVAGVFLGVRALEQFCGRRGRSAAAAGLWLTGLGVAIAFSAMTHERNRIYWSNESLMRDTVAKRPGNARARIGLGAELLSERRYAEAATELHTAVALPAGNLAIAQAHMYLGSALCGQGKLDEGIPHLNRALELDPTLNEADALLGEAYAGQGNLEPALKHFTSALAFIPDDISLLNRLAWMLATAAPNQVRNGSRAVELAERAVRLTDSRDAISLDTLAAAYAEQDRFAEAVRTARAALDQARSQGRQDLLQEIRQHLALYQEREKVRER